MHQQLAHADFFASRAETPSHRTTLTRLDLLVTYVTLPDGRTDMSIAVQNRRIVEVSAGLAAEANETLDAQGMLVAPSFVDPHCHLNAALSYGLLRVNESGTLL